MTTAGTIPTRFARRTSRAERSHGSAAFTEVYRALAPSVRGFLRARGVDDPEAVMHDVFISLLPKLDAFEGDEAGLRGLVFTIAHARAIDHHRRRGRGPVLVEYEPSVDERTSASAEDHALDGKVGVLTLLPRLLPEHREVLSLRIVADLSQEATAVIMGRSVGAVKQLQRRALLALRAELERIPEDHR